ncbi:hypothetical protein [Fodinibius halophilus]|uniref:Uncharacterized protein n=1 Tax=Fodinibius halophilus TaxID=1736908 RepID=A0A6M1T2G3_9BACT|nr:hypothetical protein [Fodinibius halophilus]NGP89666.1 hypothetical protein [Fodinibius halophilus]
MGLNKSVLNLFAILFVGVVATGIYWIYQNDSGSSEQKKGYYIRYSKGGGMGEYQSGAVYGYVIEVSFSANYTLYKQIYSEKNGKQQIREVEVKHGSLPKETFTSLSDYISQSSFSSFPSSLPNIDPRKVEINTPAPRIELSVRLKQGEKPTTVKANMGADQEYYPNQFLKLTKKLGDILRKVQETS